ncbi:MAG: ankyrin repeat-containing protein [Herminiimonas sp.]|nr:ankyrin repeat-containing protein [Herminiimonas sp.]
MKRSSSPSRPLVTSPSSVLIPHRTGPAAAQSPLSPSREDEVAAAQLAANRAYQSEKKLFEEDSANDMPFPGPFAFDPVREFSLPEDAHEADHLPPLLLAAKSGDLVSLDRLLGSPHFDVNYVDPKHGPALLVAIENNQFDAMAKLLDAGADVNGTSPKTGDTPLTAAAVMGAARLVAALVTRPGIQLDIPDEHGNSALHLAALNNHLDAVKCLLQAGSNPNLPHRISGDTPLHMAASHGHVEVVDALTKSQDINVDQTDRRGFTPLHRAVHKNHPEVVASLVAAKADMCRPNPESRRTPLTKAVTRGHLELVTALLNRANVAGHTRSSANSSPFAPLLPDVDRIDGKGDTALQLATSSGQEELVRILLNAGANVNIRHATTRNTPLLLAAESGNTRIAEMLLCQIGIDLNAWNAEGETAIHLAVSNDDAELLQRLLDAGANVNIANPVTSQTALMLAFTKDNAGIAKMLLRHPGIDHGRMNEFGYAALHLTTFDNRPELVQCLLAAGTDVSLPTLCGAETALTIAIKAGNHKIVRMLLAQRRVDLNCPDKSGNTALHYAVLADQPELVQTFLTAGADASVRNPVTLESPLNLASRMGYTALHDTMLHYRNDVVDADLGTLEVDSDWYEAL